MLEQRRCHHALATRARGGDVAGFLGAMTDLSEITYDQYVKMMLRGRTVCEFVQQERLTKESAPGWVRDHELVLLDGAECPSHWGRYHSRLVEVLVVVLAS